MDAAVQGALIGTVGTLLGAAIGGAITYCVTNRQLAHAREMQYEQLKAESRKSKEEFYYGSVLGPFLAERTARVARLLQFLWARTMTRETKTEAIVEIGTLMLQVPERIADPLAAWLDAYGDAVLADPALGDAPSFATTQDVDDLRLRAVVACRDYLKYVASDRAKEAFVVDGEIPWFEAPSAADAEQAVEGEVETACGTVGEEHA